MSSKRIWHPWPLGIVLSLMGVIGVNGFMWWKANEAPDVLVAPDYYAKAVHYEEVIQAESASQRQGWHSAITYQPAGEYPLLEVVLSDAQGAPLFGKSGVLKVYRPSDAHLDQELTLQEISPGRYTAQIPKMRTGLWKITVIFYQANHELDYYSTTRLHVSS